MTPSLHVVTGATSGIGKAIATAIAVQSNAVIAIGRNVSELELLAARFPGAVSAKCIDLLDDDSIAEFGSQIERAGSSVRALIHCAGVHFPGPLSTEPVDKLDAMYESNVRAPYLLTQRLLPALERGRGYLIFVNSSAGLTARPGAGGYSALQHAHRAMADCWRSELNDRGIRVLNIYPGRTNTPRIRTLFELEGKSFHPELLLQPEDIAALVTYALAVPSTVEVTDIGVRPATKSY